VPTPRSVTRLYWKSLMSHKAFARTDLFKKVAPFGRPRALPLTPIADRDSDRRRGGIHPGWTGEIKNNEIVGFVA